MFRNKPQILSQFDCFMTLLLETLFCIEQSNLREIFGMGIAKYFNRYLILKYLNNRRRFQSMIALTQSKLSGKTRLFQPSFVLLILIGISWSTKLVLPTVLAVRVRALSGLLDRMASTMPKLFLKRSAAYFELAHLDLLWSTYELHPISKIRRRVL